MGQIQRLSPQLVSRIAAGECIERPASVVKELVENALDAGASRVDIAIEDGGRAEIRVADDGRGMEPDDLALSVQQHATSKIQADDDLFNIHTMGFRGEALASIGSVSRLTITSRRPETDVAHEMRVEGGALSGPKPCGAPPGTTVSVRDLFYAVPARRKFLRTNQTEMGHITEQLARIALPHPGVAFTLKHQNRVTHRLPTTGNRRQRIADFYGGELADCLLPVRREGNGLRIEGLVAPPAESRGSSKWEYVFVNGRYVRDRFVSHAVKEAYRSLIDPNRYPVVFLFVTIEPERIDVNVHPTKVEVRWQDSNYVHGQVLAALRERFLASNLDHSFRTQQRENDAYKERVRAAMVDFFTKSPPPATTPTQNRAARTAIAARPASAGTGARRFEESEPEQSAAPERRVTGEGWSGDDSPVEGGAIGVSHGEAEAAHREAHAEVGVDDRTGTPADAEADSGFVGRAIQVHNAFLIVETQQGVMIIDQHALHERILYEELRRRIAEQQLEAQRLLIPQVVNVPADRMEALDTHADTLLNLGIELTPAGPHSVALQSFPSLLLQRVDHERFVRDLLDRLSEQGTQPHTETLIHDILDVMACKAAVKAGDPLTDGEIAALLQRRQDAERSSHCPHGRPTTLHLTLQDLERQFHRR